MSRGNGVRPSKTPGYTNCSMKRDGYRMKFEDGGSAIIRFPNPGATMFPDEKGTKEDNPLSLSLFIIMENIEYTMDLSDVLNTLDL
ncbi:uncharacterized protein N7496_001495 [Penicillium cataractarum]|uniref:Uncharacterized protein n=1 Tax=Penicillium cataractarum TaxID=2100454 RepID=A0A9X0B739_9EURO|nr:uncharacterized protein N7496_001495 [Penicillium cataractarum]KAJ5390427.1 hypothetical protein N7496_001495 [Penicillium cataractarum]